MLIGACEMCVCRCARNLSGWGRESRKMVKIMSECSKFFLIIFGKLLNLHASKINL